MKKSIFWGDLTDMSLNKTTVQEKAKTLLAAPGESAEKQARRMYGIYTKALQLDVSKENLADAKNEVSMQKLKFASKKQVWCSHHCFFYSRRIS